MDAPAAPELRGITKRFPGVLANDRVDFELRPGEVHALLGENGAGKSTLMNVVYGLYRPDEGEILIGGRAGPPRSAAAAIPPRVGMGHPHLLLIPGLTGGGEKLLAGAPARGAPPR